MDDTEKEIREIREIAEDNRRILKKLHKALVFQRIKTVVYWVLIIGIAVGAFVFLQPYIDGLFEAYDSLRETFNTVQDARETLSPEDIQSPL